MVIGIIAIGLGLLVPALAPASGRALENSVSLFTAELENARQTALAERTRTRVLIPDRNQPAFGSDLGLRAYTTVSRDKTTGTWRQRGRWTRLAQSAVFDPAPPSVIAQRRQETTVIDNSPTGQGQPQDFAGAYIEFLANGAASLDPATPPEIIQIVAGITEGAGQVQAMNEALRYRITVSPLTGTATVE